jgi:hypothetical protein
MDISNFLKEVDKAEKGKNEGIPFTSKRLTELTGGILKGFAYLIMGPSKTGKTSFLYEQFVFNLVDRIIKEEIAEEDVKIVLYSLEMNDTMFMFKAAARWIFNNIKYENKSVITDTKQLLGNNGVPPTILLNALKSNELFDYLSLLKRVVTVLTEGSPQGIFNFVATDCISISTLTGKDKSGKNKYSFNNPNLLYVVAIDHMSLVVKDIKGSSEAKLIIDETSTNLRRLKNAFGVTPAVLQQITPPPNNGGIKKLTLGYAELRDSKNTFQDTDFCLSLGSPFHDHIKAINYKGGVYQIIPDEDNGNVGMGDRLRLISVEKDRYGASSIRIAVAYLGEIGLFADIAPPNEVNYEYYNNIKKTF